MDKYQHIFAIDVIKYAINERVCITGVIKKKWNRKEKIGIRISDITGFATISLENLEIKKTLFQIGKRVRVYGKVVLDRKENKIIGDVENIEFLEELGQFNKELDIVEQESLVMMSKISNKIREVLSDLQFIEVNTRVISRYLGEEILEPLLVEYPGFGSCAYLSPSPSAQLIEFLTVTLLPKVFTSTISFTSSYRFQNGATEMPIVMAKGINLTYEEEQKIIINITQRIVSSLSDKEIIIKQASDDWDSEQNNTKKQEDGVFLFSVYNTNIPAIGKKWNSLVRTISRLEDDKGNVLAESTQEILRENVSMCSITFYPTQYLNWVSKAPKRQLLNLWKVFDGGSMYG